MDFVSAKNEGGFAPNKINLHRLCVVLLPMLGTPRGDTLGIKASAVGFLA